MKAQQMLTGTMFSLLATATPALADQAARQDHSGLVVWMFLGFCAMIVIAQLVPAILLLTGMLKGLVGWKSKSQNQSAE